LQRLLTDVQSVTNVGDNAWEFGTAAKGWFGVTSKKYSLKTVLNNQVVVHDLETDEVMPLSRWARENDVYNITFSDPLYFFGGGALYYRAGFLAEVEMVRRCLHVEAHLEAATSEKGRPQPADIQFSPNSIFGIAEDSLYA